MNVRYRVNDMLLHLLFLWFCHVNNCSFCWSAPWSAIRFLFAPQEALLLSFYRPPRSFPRASIRAGTLAAQRQAPPMTDSTVRTEIHQTFDIHRDLAAKIAFDLEIRNSGPEICNFRLSKILYLSLRSDAGRCADLLRARMTDTENRRQ
jgi:hypothetical protein